MPELPEVETIRRSLVGRVVGRTITGVEIYLPKAIKNLPEEEFARRLGGTTIRELGRRGKHLIIYLSSGDALVIHLRMTGQLLFLPADMRRHKHTSVVFLFENGQALHFVDQRKFGCLHLVPAGEWAEVSSMREIGPEPLSDEFTLKYLIQALAGRSGRIKALLLDQTLVAGIGNIYADESLFLAGIHPARPASSLSGAEVERLYRAIREVLAEGITHRGTTVRNYYDGEGKAGEFQERLAVYGRGNQPCPRCGTPVVRSRVAGRGTYICPNCQVVKP
ncbi:MAG: bifunctional DNA-formamidopyrimidine glycosylase/DNA-(apurinic or apyrimidinic site) lyase [Syntrophothermus sp.]